jgi:hypothetical protein
MVKTDQLNSSIYFNSPIYSIKIPEWVDSYIFNLQVVRKMIIDTVRNTVKEKK